MNRCACHKFTSCLPKLQTEYCFRLSGQSVNLKLEQVVPELLGYSFQDRLGPAKNTKCHRHEHRWRDPENRPRQAKSVYALDGGRRAGSQARGMSGMDAMKVSTCATRQSLLVQLMVLQVYARMLGMMPICMRANICMYAYERITFHGYTHILGGAILH